MQPEIKYPNSKKLLIYGLVIFILTTLFVIFLPAIVTKNSFIYLGVDKANEIGDTIGGILGPSVGLIAAALTFLAFWAQYDANIEQRKQFNQSLLNERNASSEEKKRIEDEQEIQKKEFILRQEQFERTQSLQQEQLMLQDKRAKINLFETRFYTMLSIHRDNALNIEVNKIKGRKVFLHMLAEIKLLFEVFNTINAKKDIGKLSEENIYNLAYLSFFFGIGEQSTPLVKDLVNDAMKNDVESFHSFIREQIGNDNFNSLNLLISSNELKFYWGKHYSLGVGHLRRLSHYIRHLFQIVKFVDDQPSSLLTQEEKYNYISNLRAQLSVHEQLLLYYNAISVLGKPWLEAKSENEENYISRYCMIKSIPLNAVDFYKKPKDIFKDKNRNGKSMFEWTEIKNRMAEIK